MKLYYEQKTKVSKTETLGSIEYLKNYLLNEMFLKGLEGSIEDFVLKPFSETHNVLSIKIRVDEEQYEELYGKLPKITKEDINKAVDEGS